MPRSKTQPNPLAPKSGNGVKKASHKAKPASSTKVPALETHQHESPAADDEPNYLLMVHMTLSSDPMISRILSLTPKLTFAAFHQVLQVAFGWAECHMHTFTVDIPPPEPNGPNSFTPPKTVLNLQCGANDDLDIGIEPKPQDEGKWTLEDVFEKREWDDVDGTKLEVDTHIELTYEYDMGDGWTHQITLLGRADKGLNMALGGKDAPKVLCLGGEGHPCAEDCGSEPGWENLKETFRKARGDKDLKNWYKTQCTNGDPKGLDPYKWDILDINDQLRKIFG